MQAQLKSVVPSAGRRGALLADAATMGFCAPCQRCGSAARAKGLAFFLCRFSEHGTCSQDTQPYRRFDLPGMRKRGTARGSAGIRLTFSFFSCTLSAWGDSAAGPSPVSLRPLILLDFLLMVLSPWEQSCGRCGQPLHTTLYGQPEAIVEKELCRSSAPI